MEQRPAHQKVPMKCIHCHGDMKSATAPFHVVRHGYDLLLDAVPAWVCGQCGEVYFESREVEAIQETIRVLDQQARRLAADAAGGTAASDDCGDPEACRTGSWPR